MLKIKLSCPNHTRYDPAKDGEAGIRGACRFCQALFQLYRQSVVCLREVEATL
jgi:hypothetical protein